MRTLALLLAGLILTAVPGETPRLPANPAEVPDAPVGEASFRFVVLADMNAAYGSTEYGPWVHSSVALVIDELRPELAVSAGDLVAGQKRGLTDEEIYAMWAGFDRAVAGPLREAGIAFAPVAGNHDASGYPAFEREREIYQETWRRDDLRPALNYLDDEHYPLYYTFEYKGAFFMALDITTVETLPPEQFAWIEQQLASPAAQGAALRFAMCHVPPYPVAIGRQHEIIRAPDNDRLVKLMAAHRVDAFFTGHHHAYYKARQHGLNLVSLNACGNGPRPLIGTEEPQPQSFLVVDVVDGRIADMFALEHNGRIVDDLSLPERLVHGDYVLPRFDQ